MLRLRGKNILYLVPDSNVINFNKSLPRSFPAPRMLITKSEVSLFRRIGYGRTLDIGVVEGTVTEELTRGELGGQD